MAEALSGLLPPDRPAPVFVSLVGDDTAGSFLAASLRRLRLDLSLLVTCPGAPTPCVSAVLETGGEVAAAVADVTSVEQLLTPERLSECRQQIQQASMLLAEANLSAEAVEYVARTAAQARVPVFLEPVSVPKAARLARSLRFATFVSPNASELLAMADELRRTAGLPLLPRPRPPGEAPGAAAGAGAGGGAADGVAGAAEGADGGGDSCGEDPVVELLRQLAAFAEVVLLEGTSYVVLTLGSLGAALISLCDPDAAAAASSSRPALEPLDACSGGSTGCGREGGSGPGGSAIHGAACATAAGVSRQGTRAAVRPCGPPGAAAWGLGSSGERSVGMRCGRDGCGGGDLLVRRHASSGEVGAAGVAAVPEALPSTAAAPVALQPTAPRQCVAVSHLRALPAEVVSVNGAGDTLVAGMVAALLQQHQPVQALAYGMAAAKHAVESHRNTPELDFASLRPDADRVLSSLQRLVFPASAAV